jgi:hypothetical protein
MLAIQKYLSENSLQKLKDEFDIKVNEYEDLVVLNYGIKSPKFHEICDQCRALILEKNTWKVVARSFDRFYNLGEGECEKTFQWEKAKYFEKLDGTLISVYYYKDKWNVATRSMAFAEGLTTFGTITFAELFKIAIKNTKIMEFIEQSNPNITWVFELTSPENRIVTQYSDTKISLLAARHNLNGDEYSSSRLDDWAKIAWINRPIQYDFESMIEVVENTKTLQTLEEGFVGVYEIEGSFKRIKCKNPKYVAIAHIRDGGKISAKRLLTLVLSNEYEEFLSYFPEYKIYVSFIKEEFEKFISNIETIWNKLKHIENQKEFALAIKDETNHPSIPSFLFNLKKGKAFKDIIKFDYSIKAEVRKLYEILNLKQKFNKNFNIIEDDDYE